jgi:mannose-6-phosphate isomerase-like protein (cupin superfamily)
VLTKLFATSLLSVASAGAVLAQDTAFFAAQGRVSVVHVPALGWQPLGANIRVKSVVGTVGTFSLAEFAPGATAAVHHHAREQANLGWSGGLHMTVDSQTVPLVVGAAVLVPPDVAHGLENVGVIPASMIEFHTVRRIDLVPPHPRASFPRGAVAMPMPRDRRVFAAFDSAHAPRPGADVVITGSTATLRIHRLGSDAEIILNPEPTRDAEQFVFVLTGAGEIIDASGARTVSPGTLIVAPANVPLARVRAPSDKQLLLAIFAVHVSR